MTVRSLDSATRRELCSALVDEGLVDPPDAAATGLQHLEELGGEHGPQSAQHLQLLQPPAGSPQRHFEPFDGDPGEVNHLHVLEAPQGAQQMAQAQACNLAVRYIKLSKVLGVSCNSPEAGVIDGVTALQVQFHQASATGGDGADSNARDSHQASHLKVCELFQGAEMLQTTISDLAAVA
uniref:Uncharacterized protein n=1 Tax=Arundo donax TaxID=35708 RepID=A0A0A9GS31_ARUDO